MRPILLAAPPGDGSYGRSRVSEPELLVLEGDLWKRRHALPPPARRAFAEAFYLRDEGTIARLLAKGLDPDGVVIDTTLLEWALLDRRPRMTRLILEAGATVDPPGPVSPLHLASTHGPAEAVRILLEFGANVHRTDRNRATALHRSVVGFAPLACTKLLLEAGADPNAVDAHGETVLNAAAGKARTTRLLLSFGAAREGQTANEALAYSRARQDELEVAIAGAANVLTTLGQILESDTVMDHASQMLLSLVQETETELEPDDSTKLSAASEQCKPSDDDE
ncbi:MAG: ankyrin repeat domain-containing protein [Myxococcota bacterium]